MDAERARRTALGFVERDMLRSWFNRNVLDILVLSPEEGVFQIDGSDDTTPEWPEDRLTSMVRSWLMGILNWPVVVIQLVIDEEMVDEEEQSTMKVGRSDESGLEGPVTFIARPRSSDLPDMTLLLDDLAEKHGMEVPALAEKIWLHSHRADPLYPDTPSMLLQDLKISRRTASRATRNRVEWGCVFDLMPTLRHRLHVYTSMDQLAPFEQIGIQRKSPYTEKGRNQQVGKEG